MVRQYGDHELQVVQIFTNFDNSVLLLTHFQVCALGHHPNETEVPFVSRFAGGAL